MNAKNVEVSVGLFVLAGIIGAIFLAIQVADVNLVAEEERYRVLARFDDVAGLRVRSKVSMAGVTIGRVEAIDVDMQWGDAVVTLGIFGAPGNLTADTR